MLKVWACLFLFAVFVIVAAFALDGLDDACIRRPEVVECG